MREKRARSFECRGAAVDPGYIVTFSLILALICVTQPFNPLAQFIFLMLLWGVALIVRRMQGRFSALMLIVLSLTVSCRYIWWRYAYAELGRSGQPGVRAYSALR